MLFRSGAPGQQIREVNTKINAGMDIPAATIEEAPAGGMDAQPMTAANQTAAAEDFNTRYASLIGWLEASRRVKPTPRAPAQFSLAKIVTDAKAKTTGDAVDLMVKRFLRVPVDAEARQAMIEFLDEQLGTNDVARAGSYLETPLRLLVHLIMSSPEYQLG